MHNIIITGASGFIGKSLCRQLSQGSDNIFCVVRKPMDLLPNGVTQVISDMSDYDSLGKHLPETCDIGILLAWAGTRGALRNDTEVQEKNVEANISCLRALLEKNCKTIVFAGSQAEYGSGRFGTKTKETDIPVPNTEYGKAKLNFGRRAMALCAEAGVRYLEPRIFSIFGEGDFAGTLTMSLLRKMLADDVCSLTECVQLWDYLYVDDAAQMIIRLIENPAAEGIFNIASGSVKPLKEFVMEMYEITKSKSPLHFGEIPYPPTGMVHINPSIDKLKKILGELELTSFEQGIRRMIESL